VPFFNDGGSIPPSVIMIELFSLAGVPEAILCLGYSDLEVDFV